MSSVDEISIKFTWNASKACDGIQYSLNGGNWVNGDWPQTNITGLSANTQYSVKIRVKAQDSQLWTESSVKYATTYAYPYCTSAPDFKIGNNVTLNFYNPLNRSIQIRMWSYASEAFVSELITITGTSYTGFSDVKSRLYSSIPSKSESQYNIDVHYGNNKAIKVGGKYSINGNEKPTFSNFTYQDTNGTTTALTGNNQILVNGYSNLKVTISTANKAYSNYGSPIKKYRLNVGNMNSVEKDYSETAAVELSIAKVSSPSITVTAIDSRNYTTQAGETATFKAYFKPIIKSMSAFRSNGGVGSQVTLSFDGEWWNDNFGKVANSISNISYYYKKTTDTDWTKGNIAIIPTVNDNNFTGSVLIEGPNVSDKGFDITTAYNIKIIVTDQLDNSAEYQTVLSTGAPALAIYDNKVSIGLRYDENLGGALQVRGEVIEQGIKVSVNEPDTKEKVWIQKGQNLFDKNNYNLFKGWLSETTYDFTASDWGYLIWLPCKPNTTYTVSRKPLEKNFRVGSGTVIPTHGATANVVVGGTYNLLPDLTITTSASDTYLYIYLHFETDSSYSFEEIIESLYVEEGLGEEKICCKNENNEYEEIYNSKFPYKLIQLFFDHNYVYSSDLDYICLKIGKMVVLNIYSIAFINGMENYIPFIDGLPRPTNYRIFHLYGGTSASGSTVRCAITGEGKIQTHWSSPVSFGNSANNQYGGVLVYETID